MSTDLVDRDDISEEAIMEELRRRFMEDIIYSSIGPIIIAVNPYKSMPTLYSTSSMNEYMREEIDQTLSATYSSANPSHVWTIAQSSYAQLKANMSRQAIVISGESGGTALLS